AVGGLLVDRDRGRETLDEVDVGLVHLPQELARVRGQRLDVAALSLGEDRVERERRLPRPGQPRERDQGVAGQVEVDVAEVVLTGTTDKKAVTHHTIVCRHPDIVHLYYSTRGRAPSARLAP